jgi:hypothetical protein
VRKETADCPDAETLAALADDTLSAAARREVEGHMADCDRCQALTAAMVRAEPVTGTPAVAVADEVPAWRRRAFNWLVPAAAAATAVALWVLVPGQRTPLPEAAREQQTAATSLPRSSEVPPTSQPVAEEPLLVPGESPAGAAPSERDANLRFEGATPAAPRPVAEPSLKAETPVAETPVAGGLQASGTQRRDEAAQNEAVAVAERAANQEAAPAAARAAAGVTGGRAAPPPPAAAPAPPPAAAPPPPAPPPPAAPLARRLEATASVELVSPNPQIRWRIGPGAMVQYSADGGVTWTMQQTGVSTELTAGSAPAPAVCWLVGRGGLVLRTTDGGRQWQRLPFPEMVDLTAITASTVRNATVVLADGRRFATDDGGVMWTPVR